MNMQYKTISLESYDGYGFEKLCADIFERAGYGKATVTPKSGDGGKDIIFRKANGEIIYAECKHYLGSRVGRPVIQKLHSAMITGNASSGLVITSGKFSPDAEEYVRQNNIPIKLVDLSLLSSIAHTLGIIITQKSVAIPMYCHRIPREFAVKETLVNYLSNKYQSYPNCVDRLIVFNHGFVNLMPFYSCEYDLDFTLSSSNRILSHDVVNNCQMIINGNSGNPITEEQYVLFKPSEKIPYSHLDSGTWNRSITPFTVTETDSRRIISDEIKDKHAITVHYTGNNNVSYSKSGKPSSNDFQIYNLEQIYIPVIHQGLSIRNRDIMLNDCFANDSVLYVPNIMNKCSICGEPIYSGIICNDCGSFVHSPRKYDSHSFICESCGKTICRNCTYIANGKHLCLDCAKKTGKYARISEKMNQRMIISLIIVSSLIIGSIPLFIFQSAILGFIILILGFVVSLVFFYITHYQKGDTSKYLHLPLKK